MAQSTKKLLVVDDDPNNFDVIEALLHNENYEINYSSSARRTLSLLENGYAPDVILLDVMMPGMNGIELCQHLKSNPEWQAIPIIMVTALTDKQDLSRCFDAGAEDFISKPVDSLELRARVRSMLRIYQQYQNIQQLNKELLLLNQSLGDRVQQQTSQLQRLIDYDESTNLPSRAFLVRHINQLITDHYPAILNQDSTCNSDCRDLDVPSFALVHIDCDQFQLIKDSLGHLMAEKLLLSISQRLRPLQQEGMLLVKLGEDEFGFFMMNVQREEQIHLLIDKIFRGFSLPFNANSYEFYLSAGIGVAQWSTRHRHALDLLRDADLAVHKAKVKGRGECIFFDPQMHDAVSRRLQLETDLRRAIDQGEFLVFYQPILNLNTLKVAGFEALIRWRHPTRGFVPPGEFIDCIEQTGLIIPVGLFVLEQACRQLVAWHEQGFNHLFVSVNLSVRQFASPSLIADINHIISVTNTPWTSLKLEITESSIIEDPSDAIKVIQSLRDLQIQVSLDDFGTGYSSLGNLHQFQFDALKVDRIFIQSIESRGRNIEILKAIVSLGHALGMSIVAEGIETVNQLTFLKHLGCEYGQGFYLSRPLPGHEATQFLTKSPLIVDRVDPKNR